MDAIDGKQARRTGTGSPLGELFDHGLDCIANAFFLPSMLMCLQAGKDLDKFNMLRTDLKKLQFQNHRRKQSYAAYPMHRSPNSKSKSVSHAFLYFIVHIGSIMLLVN